MGEMTVCFDIGGVLVRISQTWQECAKVAGIPAPNLNGTPVPLVASDALNRFQEGVLDEPEYYSELSQFLGCSTAEATAAHRAILQDEYTGVRDLVCELVGSDIRTACLSNTNAPHWQALTQSDKYPSMNCLDRRCASHEWQLAKPDHRIYLRFNAELDLAPESTIFFDDSQTNVDEARAVGWNAFRIDPYGDPSKQMRKVLEEMSVL